MRRFRKGDKVKFYLDRVRSEDHDLFRGPTNRLTQLGVYTVKNRESIFIRLEEVEGGFRESLFEYLDAPDLPYCHGSRSDGECNWSECPQLKDYQNYCPYAAAWEDYWDEGYF